MSRGLFEHRWKKESVRMLEPRAGLGGPEKWHSQSLVRQTGQHFEGQKKVHF